MSEPTREELVAQMLAHLKNAHRWERRLRGSGGVYLQAGGFMRCLELAEEHRAAARAFFEMIHGRKW